MKSFSEYIFTFLLGFFLYGLLETIGRGYTHWSMTILGGIALSILYRMEHQTLSYRSRAFFGALFITAAEFSVGILENIILGWDVWDYSDVWCSFLGQICLPFSCLWFLLCIPASYLCTAIYFRFHERGPVPTG